PNYLLDDAQKRQQQGMPTAPNTGTAAPSNPQASGQGGGVSGAAPIPSANQPGVNKGGGGGFVNFATYLGLNKDQGAKMANQLDQHVGGAEAQGALDSAVANFNQKSTAGTPVYQSGGVVPVGDQRPVVATIPETGETFYGIGNQDASESQR